MSFIETLRRARVLLREERRLSLRALKRELGFDDDEIREVTDELVDAQRVAILEGSVLVWVGEPKELAAPRESAAAPLRDPRAYTPKHLADKILKSKSALEGERKQVTVLFADVKGSMELAEQVDPEEWHRILDRFFQILADGVHRFEGTVNQYTGDGIMALFGAPIAHEDHARRACYAALHLRDELRRYTHEVKREHGLTFSVRMGINSGGVVVGKIGNDLRMDYTAQGQTVGLAARLEELASPDTCYLGPDTATLLGEFFELEDLGLFSLKGLREAVRVHQLRGVGQHRTRLDASRARGLTRFVGRERESAALDSALERAFEGQGQVVGVVAEAGLGKSRLCFEFAERCRQRGLLLREAHCVAHGRMIPLLPILEVTRAYFGITGHDTDETARDKIAGRVVRLDPELAGDLPLLFEFVGVPDPQRPSPEMPPETRQKRLFGMIRQLIHARSEREPGIVIFEDLHWIDPASDAFLENLVDSISGTRSLVLVNFRPEYHAEWMQKSYYQQLPLLPLGKEAIQELLRDLLGSDPSLGDLPQRIRQRTAGNPFFMEELVQSLVESGALAGARGAYRLVRSVDEAAIPPTVQAVLAARIDRLAEREKHVLQTASVIGKTFSESLLARVVDLPKTERAEALRALLSGEFLYEEALYPEAEYTFKHPLTQEVAYASQLGDRRRRIHASTARAIEELESDKLDEQAALLAHHWEEADEPFEAARWHRRAAVWAGASQPVEARLHWRKVRELLDGVPETAEMLALGVEARGQLILYAARIGGARDQSETDGLFAEAKALALRSEDLRTRAVLQMHYAYFKMISGHSEQAMPALDEAQELVQQLRAPDLEAAIFYCRVQLGFAEGHWMEALANAEKALCITEENPELASELFGFSIDGLLLAGRAWALAGLGQVEESALRFEEAIAALREKNPVGLGVAYWGYAALASTLGDPALALARGHELLETMERLGVQQAFPQVTLGLAHLANGDAESALPVLEEGLRTTRQTGTMGMAESQFRVALARAHLMRGDLVSARSALGSSPRDLKAWSLEYHLLLAQILLRSDGPAARDRVEAALSEAERLIKENSARLYQPRAHEVRAELAGCLGDGPTRTRELREAHRLFTEMGATGHAERVGRELGL